MYSVVLKNVMPQGGLTCLFAKDTPDESNLWHMRLGHFNEKDVLSSVTDDFSRFSLVFFLATKDETSEILKTFITGIENLIDLKVKVIRCDNGTEFKNRVMNQFCEMMGIKREFSVARTPQQNEVAEKKNRTLKMPTTRQGISSATIEQLIVQCVADAISAYEGLREDIKGKVTASKPTKIQEAICMAHDLMDQVVRAKVAKDADNKRKWEDGQGGNPYQQQTKRQEVVRAMLLNHVTRKDMLELYHSATGATFIITSVPVPLIAVTVGRSVTKQETVGPLLL
ncbi:putative ribonuclease H-like domain-containing protein [Tanacetum coccineum]